MKKIIKGIKRTYKGCVISILKKELRKAQLSVLLICIYNEYPGMLKGNMLKELKAFVKKNNAYITDYVIGKYHISMIIEKIIRGGK